MADYSEFIGRPTGTGTITLERSPLSNFAKAVKDENPIYLDATAAAAAGFDSVPAPVMMATLPSSLAMVGLLWPATRSGAGCSCGR